jgi:phospholipid-binding lipoprotein MlaA
MMKKVFLNFVTALSICISSTAAIAADEGMLETYNRSMFNFNTMFDDYLMKPVAKGYRAVTNDFVRERVRNFFANLKEPATMINHTLQGNFSDTGKSGGRFLINSTLGLLGTFDVASGWGLKNNKTDFDETLAAWCVPDGPFFILPLLGPSTPRATAGMVADTFTGTTYWVGNFSTFGNDVEKYSFYYGITALGFVSLREEKIEFLDNLTANSVDPYSTIKSAYIQNRLKIGVCGKAGASAEDAGYDFDFDDMDDE